MNVNCLPPGEKLMKLFFEPTATSQSAGRDFVQRLARRTEDKDTPTTAEAAADQLAAMAAWAKSGGEPYTDLKKITQPVLVTNGNNDIMIPTRNSHLLGGFLPDATVTIYPDAGHGFLFQYAEQFAAQVLAFLA